MRDLHVLVGYTDRYVVDDSVVGRNRRLFSLMPGEGGEGEVEFGENRGNRDEYRLAVSVGQRDKPSFLTIKVIGNQVISGGGGRNSERWFGRR